jgi:hypothetical protein
LEDINQNHKVLKEGVRKVDDIIDKLNHEKDEKV